jgi:hypothetical protein
MKFILIILLFTQSALARLYFDDATSPELITSARALAMGGAYGAKVSDPWAAFYNPAGLGSVRKLQVHLLNLHLETNNGFLDTTGGSGNFLKSVGNYSDAFTASGVRKLLVDKPGNMTHAKVSVFPNITFRGITLGYVYSHQQRARLKDASSDFEVAERLDSGPMMSLSLSLFGGVVKFGATATVLTRKELWKDIASSDPTTIDKDVDYKQGTMTHLVAGTRITFPVFLLPTFSLVVRNSSQSEWYNSKLGGAPDIIPSTVDASFSLTPFTSRTGRFHFEIGVKDLGDRYEDVPSNRKLMTGFEMGFMRMMFFRAGFGDGWGSGGIGVRGKGFVFDLTTYAIEASPDGNREDEDRRYALNMSLGF